jgi:hypothetical protein
MMRVRNVVAGVLGDVMRRLVKIPRESRLREGDHSNGEYASTHEALQFLLSPPVPLCFCWVNPARACAERGDIVMRELRCAARLQFRTG